MRAHPHPCPLTALRALPTGASSPAARRFHLSRFGPRAGPLRVWAAMAVPPTPSGTGL